MSEKFTTLGQQRAREALSKFCLDMERRNPYDDVNWDAATWVVGVARRASARKVERLHFTRHRVADDSKNTGNLGDEFQEPFGSFVRSVIVWRAVNAKQIPTALAQMVLVRAFRYLYEEVLKSETLRGVEVSPTHLHPRHFSDAARVAVGREAEQSAYRIANYLSYIAGVIDRHGLTDTPLQWVHGVPRPENSGGLKSDRVGKQFWERREKLLPSDEVLYAIAEISNRTDLAPSDRIRQRLVDLLFVAGFRINENLTIRRNAIIEEPAFDDLGQLARDASGQPLSPYFGIRFIPEKKGEEVSGIKWILTELKPVARRAFEELLDLTTEFAKNAEFAYKNPGRVRLGEPWDSMPPETLLSTCQVAEMLGLSYRTAAATWLDRFVGPSSRRNGRHACPKREIEHALRERMGPLEVLVGDKMVPLHEFLAVVPINCFHGKKASMSGTATLVVDQNISDYLCGRSEKGSRSKSIFERLGYNFSDGKPMRIKTHGFRHFLDSVSSSGGLPELVRARWMGRRDISQNSAYDHESGFSLAKKIRLRLIEGGVLGPIADATQKVVDPIAREETADDLIRATHKTLLGRCFHDWASSPCPEHEACWGCGEHLLIKGNPTEMAEAERQLEETMSAISAAGMERAEGTYGVDNWMESHVRKRDQLTRILEVHRDPAIPDGTIIHLRKDGSKHVKPTH